MLKTILDRIFGTPNAIADIEEIHSVIISIPENDIDDSPENLSEPIEIGYAEGQTFGIEYENAKGEFSQRKITVRDIAMGTTCPLLRGYCHKTKMFKAFRTDRISTIFDMDGELFEVDIFLNENLGIPLEVLKGEYNTRSNALRTSGNHKAELSSLIKNQATLLNALAMADGIICENEIDVIIRYSVSYIERTGIFLSDNEIIYLQKYLKRLRPSQKNVLDSLENIYVFPLDDKQRFLQSCMDVVKADNKISPSESEMLQDFTNHLTGVTLIAEIRDYRDNTSNLECSFQ